MKIAIVNLPKTLKSASYAIEEFFYINNIFCKKEDEITINTKHVTLSDMSKNEKFDLIIIPPIMSGEKFEFHISALNDWLKKQYFKGTLISSACVGSFFLASSGILDGKSATTHWAYSEIFKQNFPKVNLDTDKILIEDENIITAGGFTSYMDLCLYLVEKYHSNTTATNLANLLVVDKVRKSQKSYKTFSTIFLFDDEDIKRIITWMQKNIQKQISNAILAKKLNISERTFSRRFKKALNTTPNKYLQNLRIQRAKELLITSNKSFDEITFEVGFFNESSFRKLFKKETSLNPIEFRKKNRQSIIN